MSESIISTISQSQSPDTTIANDFWVEHLIDSHKWLIRNNWLPLFESDNCPDWLDLENDPRASLVKSNQGRGVWRVQIDSHQVFVKISQPTHRWAPWRRFFLGSDSAHERRIGDYAATHGIDTVKYVAVSDIKIPGERPLSILISEGLPNASSLMDFWSELNGNDPQTRRIKNQVIDGAACLIARAHQNGFQHSDLHAGNVLVVPDKDGNYRVLFVDLHNVHIGRPLSDRAVAKNLARFNQWFRLNGLLTDRIRFLKGYLHWREEVFKKSRAGRQLNCNRSGLVRLIERAAYSHAHDLYVQRDRRVMRTGRYFAKFKIAGGWRAYVFLQSKHKFPGSRVSEISFTVKQWKEWLKCPSDWLDLKEQKNIIKKSPTVKVCRTQLHLVGAEPLPVICKETLPRNIIKRVLNSIWMSRSMRTWKRANALLHRRIPTARPLAVAERRRYGLLLKSMMITESIEDACDLDNVLTVQMRQMTEDTQRRYKRKIIDSLVKVVRQLNECGLYHRDFKAPNIIVQWNQKSDEDPRIFLVDLDGINSVRRFNTKACINMLVRLNVSLEHCHRVSTTDRLRFLKGYLNRPGRPCASWKQIWRQLDVLCDQKRIAVEKRRQELIKKYGRF